MRLVGLSFQTTAITEKDFPSFPRCVRKSTATSASVAIPLTFARWVSFRVSPGDEAASHSAVKSSIRPYFFFFLGETIQVK